jgi:hypothetical protein
MKRLRHKDLFLLFSVFVLSITSSNASAGVGTSLDTEIISPVENSAGKFVYHAKLHCGTIRHGFPAQQPSALPPGPDFTPGYYYSYLNITNPQPNAVLVNVFFVPIGTAGDPVLKGPLSPVNLAQLPVGNFTIDCDSVVEDFGASELVKATQFASVEVILEADEEINVSAYQSTKNVLQAANAFSIYFDCIDGPVTAAGPTWLEVTNLLVTNSSSFSGAGKGVFFDGQGNILAHADLDLAPRDVDEINICRTLKAAGVPIPPKGQLIVFVNVDVGVDVIDFNCWMVDYFGKYFQNVDEPSGGRVIGIGKTVCLPTTIDINVLLNQVVQQNVPPIALVYSGNSKP